VTVAGRRVPVTQAAEEPAEGEEVDFLASPPPDDDEGVPEAEPELEPEFEDEGEEEDVEDADESLLDPALLLDDEPRLSVR
jgi:hypothetical protein